MYSTLYYRGAFVFMRKRNEFGNFEGLFINQKLVERELLNAVLLVTGTTSDIDKLYFISAGCILTEGCMCITLLYEPAQTYGLRLAGVTESLCFAIRWIPTVI